MKSVRVALRRRHLLETSILWPISEPDTSEAGSSNTDFRDLVPIGCPTTPNSTNPKVYKTISVDKNEIRILTLLPSARGSKMRIELRCEKLDAIPSYDALSYAWSDPVFTRLIWVNGNVMAISKNLESALENLRSPTEPRTLWVDAICIDQGNLQERNEQVALMRKIYQEAWRVLIWLGEKKENTDLAFEMINTLSANWDDFPDMIFEEDPAKAEIDAGTMEALRDVFSQRAWWSRIWVIQEVVNAKRALIICGDKSLSWGLLEKLLDSEQDTVLAKFSKEGVRAQLASAMHSAILFTAVKNQYEPFHIFTWDRAVYKYGMCSLLALFETNLCTDPRDRIYALQNITGVEDGTIEPDYGKEMVEVFAESTQITIATSGDLDILAYAYRSNEISHNGPSWVPNWSIPRQFSTLIAGPRKERIYHADKDDNQHSLSKLIYWQNYKSRRLLGIVGCVRDEIVQILHVVDTENPDWRNWFRCWLPEEITDGLVRLPDNDDVNGDYHFKECDKYWQTLMLGVHRPSTGWPIRIKGAIAYRHYRKLFLSWTQHPRYAAYDMLDISPSESLVNTESGFEECMDNHLHGWAFCQTKSGAFGWVPQTACVGDLICMATGSSLPLVLRLATWQVREKMRELRDWTSIIDMDLFELVGTAYIHGKMDGIHQFDKPENPYRSFYLI